MKKSSILLACLIGLFANLSGCGGKAVIGSSSDNATNSLTLGNEAIQTKDYNNAVQDYQNAINANPNSAGAYQGLGTAYYYLGQKDQALSAFEKASQLDPNNTKLTAFVNKLKNGN